LREYLARVVNKATGAHHALLVTPQHRPVFPPVPSEAASASLQASGELTFCAPAAISPSSRRGRGGAGASNVSSEVTTAAPCEAQQRFAAEYREPAEVLNQIAGRRETPDAVQNAIAAVLRAIDASPRGSGSQQTSSGEVAAATVQNRDAPKDEITAHEIALGKVISQNGEPATAQELQEPGEASQLAPRQNSLREGSSGAAEESAVQVRIGRIEVRVAAPVPVPRPPAAKPQGPRGFAEYEAVRRYMTRSRN